MGINNVVNAPSVFQLNKLENDYLLRFLFVKQFEMCFEPTRLRRCSLRDAKIKPEMIVEVLRSENWVELNPAKVALGTVPLYLRVLKE